LSRFRKILFFYVPQKQFHFVNTVNPHNSQKHFILKINF